MAWLGCLNPAHRRGLVLNAARRQCQQAVNDTVLGLLCVAVDDRKENGQAVSCMSLKDRTDPIAFARDMVPRARDTTTS